MFQTKYMQRRAALHRTVTVARRSVGSARSLATSWISDSMYLYKYHSWENKLKSVGEIVVEIGDAYSK